MAGRIWSPMLQIVYWGMAEYTSAEAKGATDGLVEQSKALLLRVRWICILALYCNMPPQNILLRRLPADLTDTVSERPNSLWVVVNKDAYTGTC